MKDLNKVIFVGRLTAEPIAKTTSTGQAMATFRIATNSYWRDSTGEMQSRADFHDIVAWRAVAEVVLAKFHKGDAVLIEAKLQPRKWEAADGAPRRSIDIVASSVIAATDDAALRKIEVLRDLFSSTGGTYKSEIMTT